MGPAPPGQPYAERPGTGLPPLAPESGASVTAAPDTIAAVATFAALVRKGGGLVVYPVKFHSAMVRPHTPVPVVLVPITRSATAVLPVSVPLASRLPDTL